MTPTFATVPAPLISVIITCYNHGHYLADAIESVLQQQYTPVEIIVVDDGSTDNTKAVVQRFTSIKYIYQENAGLSAARNAGIDYSTGDFLVFLDADDWLLENALAINYAHLAQYKEIAFVSGAHIKVTHNKKLIEEVKHYITADHYQWLLKTNYIGMHATVLFRRWAFDTLRYDVSLKACEDYDVYLKIARAHPVLHHTDFIAAYRMHHQNMSGNIPLMLNTVVQVLMRQQRALQSEAEKASLQDGLKIWKGYYSHKLYYHLLFDLATTKKKSSEADVAALKEYDPILYSRYIEQGNQFLAPAKNTLEPKMKTRLKKMIPGGLLHKYQRLRGSQPLMPQPGEIHKGDFNRTKPFSTDFGFDRGGAVDRYYIENFLQQQAYHIKGRVLEIGDNEYTLRYGGQAIMQSDILHMNEHNSKATFIGDLSQAPHLPDAAFDCIILTQTLQFIYHHKEALQTCYRILKPGGTLLLTVPGITQVDYNAEWKKIWFWSYTDTVINRMLSEIFIPEHVKVETFGNVLVATAFLYGMGLPEMRQEQLDATDPHYQVIITAKATKEAAGENELV